MVPRAASNMCNKFNLHFSRMVESFEFNIDSNKRMPHEPRIIIILERMHFIRAHNLMRRRFLMEWTNQRPPPPIGFPLIKTFCSLSVSVHWWIREADVKTRLHSWNVRLHQFFKLQNPKKQKNWTTRQIWSVVIAARRHQTAKAERKKLFLNKWIKPKSVCVRYLSAWRWNWLSKQVNIEQTHDTRIHSAMYTSCCMWSIAFLLSFNHFSLTTARNKF